MGRSIAEDMMSLYHEAISVYQNGLYHVADTQKGRSASMGNTIMCMQHGSTGYSFEALQVWKTRGFHRKNMKRCFDWDMYHQRSKVETIFSVIKRTLG